MDALVLWTLMIAITTAVACSLCGVYLVVKHESMVAEALSHAVLPGIIAVSYTHLTLPTIYSV